VSEGPAFSIVVPTLLRPSYAALVASIRRQTFRDYELLARADQGPDVNEYTVRNRAVATARGDYCLFLDDDTTIEPTFLARLAVAIRGNNLPAAIGGPIRGSMFGSGNMILDEPKWGVGANMCFRRGVFTELGGFEDRWGLPTMPRGWRGDSDLWFRVGDRYPDGILWLHDLIVDHPNPMTSVWQPAVEDIFFRRHRAKYIERFIPVDPRGQQFLLETQDLSPEETARVVECRRALRARIPGLPVLPQEK
jgi:glycosyltransferase involved in cell wall biosynthesis